MDQPTDGCCSITKRISPWSTGLFSIGNPFSCTCYLRRLSCFLDRQARSTLSRPLGLCIDTELQPCIARHTRRVHRTQPSSHPHRDDPSTLGSCHQRALPMRNLRHSDRQRRRAPFRTGSHHQATCGLSGPSIIPVSRVIQLRFRVAKPKGGTPLFGTESKTSRIITGRATRAMNRGCERAPIPEHLRFHHLRKSPIQQHSAMDHLFVEATLPEDETQLLVLRH